MDRIVINLGDFLKNAGIVGLNYILEDVICAEKDKDYGWDKVFMYITMGILNVKTIH